MTKKIISIMKMKIVLSMGGIDIEQAEMLIAELRLAIDYMNESENDKISTTRD